MFKSGSVLDTKEKIAAAIHNRSPVTVWSHGKIVDYGGLIELQTDAAVKIGDVYYLKENNEFRIR